MNEFLKEIEPLSAGLSETKIIVPIYVDHLTKFKIPDDNFNNIFNNSLISGFLVFYDAYKSLTKEKILEYREFILLNIKSEIVVSSTNGHPSK